jgi:prepilin-type N-terminal cleavage/methylation domain-containing protein
MRDQKTFVPPNNKGFSIPELVVSIAIIGIMTAVGAYSYLDFRDRTMLDDVVTTIVLDLKQAQSQGVASVENPRYAKRFNIPVGVHFDIAGSSTEYRIFTDNPTNGANNVGFYDGVGGDCLADPGGECLEIIALPDRFRISELCGTDFAGTENCFNADTFPDVLSVSYVRPNLDARILRTAVDVLDSAKITIRSARDRSATIVVTRAGLIYIE